MLTKKQRMIPKAMIIKGYIRFEMKKLHEPAPPTRVSQEITRAAQVDSAKEPNRSALIPATSPTLSPTLSAMVAGL